MTKRAVCLMSVITLFILSTCPLFAADKNNYLVVGHVATIDAIDYIHSTVTFTVVVNSPTFHAASPQFLCDLDSDLACFSVVDSVGDCVEIKATLKGNSTSGFLFHPTSYSTSSTCTTTPAV